jgi:beta-1,4-mannosyltransferase
VSSLVQKEAVEYQVLSNKSDLRRIRVLQSIAKPRPNYNPYFIMLFQAIAVHDDPRWFSWRKALFGRYDLFHLHLPETFVASTGRVKTGIKRVLLEALILRLRLSRTPVVWTVHHIEPYERNYGGAERARLRLESLAKYKIFLHHGEGRDGPTTTTIVIGEYREWYEALISEVERARDQFLCFGLMRPYKNVESLIEAFQEANKDSWRLVLAGRPSPRGYASDLTDQIAGHPRIDARFEYQDDRDLIGLIQSSAIVVLPYLEMYNSSAALTALSLGTPVLVPDTESSREMQDEFGREWVMTFSGALSTPILEEALSHCLNIPHSSFPDLSKRSWTEIGERHHNVYATVHSGQH